MASVEGKDSTMTTESFSEPVASNNQTPNSLKAKRKIVKKPVNNSFTSASKLKDTPSPAQGRKKILKKNIVGGSKIINKKEDDVLPCVDGGDTKQEIALIGEQSKTSLENSTGKIVLGNKILRKKIVVRNKIIDKNKEDVQFLNGEDMKQKNVLIGEQSKSNLENLKEKSVSESNKMNDSDDKVASQNLNGEGLKQNEVISEEHNKNNEVKLKKKKKKVIVVKKKVSNSNNKEGSQALNTEESKQKNATSVEKKKKVIVVKKVSNSNNKEGSQALNTEESKQKNATGMEKKEGIVVKKVSNSNNKEGSQALNTEESKQKYATSMENSKKRPEDVKNKVEHNEKNRDNFGGSRNKRHKQNPDDRNGSPRNQQKQKDKEKHSGNELTRKEEGKKHRTEGERRVKKSKKVGGVIFFCSAKTKPDCFRYSIMGVSTNRQDLVMSIKPGIKLFLYDFGNKLLYGIYRASSPGGMKLEPAAFNGSFPVQVRFEVYQDCFPLPESVFKRAIEENYDGKNKFDPELTYEQVNKLMTLFKPTEVKQLASPVIYPPQSVGREEAKERETEYLAQHRREPLTREPYNYEERRRYDLHLKETDELLTYRRAPSTQREASPEKLFLSEKDYRTHGLRRERRNVSPPRSHIAPTLELDSRSQGPLLVHPGSTYRYGENEYPTTYGHLSRQELHSSAPYESSSTASIVDSYLKVPYYGSSSDLYQPPLRREREEVALGSYSLGRRETTHQPEASYLLRRETYPTEASYTGRRENHDVGSLYSSYASKALSEYNQQHTSEGTMPQTSLPTVSSRYSFAGPSRQYQ